MSEAEPKLPDDYKKRCIEGSRKRKISNIFLKKLMFNFQKLNYSLNTNKHLITLHKNIYTTKKQIQKVT